MDKLETVLKMESKRLITVPSWCVFMPFLIFCFRCPNVQSKDFFSDYMLIQQCTQDFAVALAESLRKSLLKTAQVNGGLCVI